MCYTVALLLTPHCQNRCFIAKKKIYHDETRNSNACRRYNVVMMPLLMSLLMLMLMSLLMVLLL